MNRTFLLIATAMVLVFASQFRGNEYNQEVYTYDIARFENIAIDLNSAVIELIPSDYQELKVEINQTNLSLEDHSIYIDENESTLEIKQLNYINDNMLSTAGYKEDTIRIYYPSEYKKLSYALNVNNLNLSVSSLYIKNLTINSAEVVSMITDSTIENYVEHVDYGHLGIYRSNINKMDYLARRSEILLQNNVMSYIDINNAESSNLDLVDSRIKQLDVIGSDTIVDISIKDIYNMNIVGSNIGEILPPFVKTSTGIKYEGSAKDEAGVINQEINIGNNKLKSINISN